MNAKPYMHSILWCCTSCGFVLEGGQPTMECQICEAYKESFVNSPAHVEAAVRAKTGEELFNSAEGRKLRLEQLRAGGYLKKFRIRGRFIEPANLPQESRKIV